MTKNNFIVHVIFHINLYNCNFFYLLLQNNYTGGGSRRMRVQRNVKHLSISEIILRLNINHA